MIIQNGTIVFNTADGGGLDPVTGYPVKVKSSWGVPIPCQFYPVRQNLLARAGTEALHKASYTVLVEDKVQGERIRLRDMDGNAIGDFSVISVEMLQAVGQSKILI